MQSIAEMRRWFSLAAFLVFASSFAVRAAGNPVPDPCGLAGTLPGGDASQILGGGGSRALLVMHACVREKSRTRAAV